jgi:hypothetical protein
MKKALWWNDSPLLKIQTGRLKNKALLYFQALAPWSAALAFRTSRRNSPLDACRLAWSCSGFRPLVGGDRRLVVSRSLRALELVSYPTNPDIRTPVVNTHEIYQLHWFTPVSSSMRSTPYINFSSCRRGIPASRRPEFC